MHAATAMVVAANGGRTSNEDHDFENLLDESETQIPTQFLPHSPDQSTNESTLEIQPPSPESPTEEIPTVVEETPNISDQTNELLLEDSETQIPTQFLGAGIRGERGEKEERRRREEGEEPR